MGDPTTFGHVPQEDTRPRNVVLGDRAGRKADFHVVVLTEDGRGIYGPPETVTPTRPTR